MSRTQRLAATTTIPEPTVADLDAIVAQLESNWTARITVRRHVTNDIGLREIYVSLDDERIAVLYRPGEEVSKEVEPGPHRLRVHNTLFWRTADFTVSVGEHASFVATNRKGFGTFSIFAYLLGANIIYLTLVREAFYGETA
jgi:hypothetical protein